MLVSFKKLKQGKMEVKYLQFNNNQQAYLGFVPNIGTAFMD